MNNYLLTYNNLIVMSKKWMIAVLSGILTLAGTACNEDPVPPTVADPELTVKEPTVEIPAGGGTFSVEYSVENTIEGVQAETQCAAEWISGFDLSKNGKISFSVDRNSHTEGREAVVTVTYYQSDISGEFTVKQSAGGVFTLDALTIEADAQGGGYSVTYSCSEGAVPDIDAIEVSPAESWVKDFDTSAAGTISFVVEPNTAVDERRCSVEVTFTAGGVPQSFTVVQHGGDHTAPFVIDIEEVTYKDVTYNILPADKQMTYITMGIKSSTFDNYPSDEEYFLMELGLFQMLARVNGISLEEYLRSKVLLSGDLENKVIDALSPETSYYVYVYGVSPHGERLTEIVKKHITTEAVPNIGMTFTYDYEFNSQLQKASVIAYPGPPAYNEHPYYFAIMRTEGLMEGDDMAYLMQGYLNYVVESVTMQGGTVYDAMDLIAYRGIGVNIFECISGKEYVIFGAAIDMDAGLVISEVTEERFDAPEVRPSDNIITFSTGNEGFMTIDVTIETTNNDPYVFLMAPANEFAGMTDEEILADLLNPERNLSNSIHNGRFQRSFTDRIPGTDYCGYAFGYVAGIATTKLFKFEYSTHELDECDLEMKVLYDKYFDAKALKAAYPEEFAGMPGAMTVVMPVRAEVTPSADGAKYWYNVYEGDHTESTNVYRMAETLLREGCPLPSANLYFPYEGSIGVPHTLVGIVADAEGNYGGMFLEKIVFTREGMSPVDEYVPSGQNASAGKHYTPAQFVPSVAPASHDGFRFDVEQVKTAAASVTPVDRTGPVSFEEFIAAGRN